RGARHPGAGRRPGGAGLRERVAPAADDSAPWRWSLSTAETMERVFQSGPSDDEIVAALQEPQPILRERAIALAARHLAPEVLGRFVGDDENAALRNAALAALERQGPYAVPHLVSLSRGEDLEVAIFAVPLLSRIRDPGWP